VPKCLSVNIIVTAPARTGSVATKRNAVTNQPHAKIGIFINVMPGARILKMVTITLIEPRIEDIPNV